MEARTDRAEIRNRSRGRALAGISAALRVCAPGLEEDAAQDIAAVVLNNMKIMIDMTRKNAPTTPGAPDELRRMNRLYLSTRLALYRQHEETMG